MRDYVVNSDYKDYGLGWLSLRVLKRENDRLNNHQFKLTNGNI